jgi:serine/threonine protein phosphatase PrpC
VGRLTWAIEIAATRGQDRAAVFERDGGIVIALADGAGGTGGGELAAEAVIAAVRDARGRGGGWGALISELDEDPQRLGGGETTAVIASVGESIAGASVGDSGAWLIRGADVDDLTAAQERKPLLGAGCLPIAFHRDVFAGTLLVASDGLLKYATRADIARVTNGDDLAAVARDLVELVRLRAGGLQDDVSLVVCRTV